MQKKMSSLLTHWDWFYDVVLTSFSPAHSEGELWDKIGTCSKTKPHKEGEGEATWGMDAEMGQLEVEEVEAAGLSVRSL